MPGIRTQLKHLPSDIMPMPTFAVAFLPYLSNQHFTPVQLATALARLGYGRLVRADYTRHGIFAYIAYTGWRIHMADRKSVV